MTRKIFEAIRRHPEFQAAIKRAKAQSAKSPPPAASSSSSSGGGPFKKVASIVKAQVKDNQASIAKSAKSSTPASSVSSGGSPFKKIASIAKSAISEQTPTPATAQSAAKAIKERFGKSPSSSSGGILSRHMRANPQKAEQIKKRLRAKSQASSPKGGSISYKGRGTVNPEKDKNTLG